MADSIDHRKENRSHAWPSYSIAQKPLKHCTLTKKVVGAVSWALFKPPQERHDSECPDPQLSDCKSGLLQA